MVRFRQMARQLNIDMVNQDIACLPKNNRKYAGSVTRADRAGGKEAWVLRIRQGDFRYQKMFANEAEAYNWMCNINVREGLEIKNRFTVFENKVEVYHTSGY